MNRSRDSIQKSEKENHEHDHSNELEPPGWIQQALLTTYGKVIKRGNQKPYKVDMLFELPEQISLAHCQQLASEDLKEMLKTEDLSIWTCAKLTFDPLFKDFCILVLNDFVMEALPFILAVFVGWLQEEPHPGPHSQRYHWRMKGYVLAVMAFILSTIKIFSLCKNIEYEIKVFAKIKNILNVRSFSGMFQNIISDPSF